MFYRRLKPLKVDDKPITKFKHKIKVHGKERFIKVYIPKLTF